MEQKLFLLIRFFLPTQGIKTIVQHRKAAILIFTHFYIFTSLLLLVFFSSTITKYALLPCLIAPPLIIASLFFFKKNGGVNRSGNILSIIWHATLMPILLQTGGINSPYLPWLYSIILIMVLVEHYLWATMWFVLASVSCLALYFLGKTFPELNTRVHTDFDMCVSYLFVGFFMFTNLVVFERHQIFVLNLMKSKTETLKKQKIEIAEYADKLENIKEKLIESNRELQSFAFAASHDLKEPLRMITMYTQLLERRLKPTLDDNTTEYMNFVTDGVIRMQKLLDNLLAYSLLGKDQRELKVVDINKKISKALLNLTVLVEETNATVTFEEMPQVMGLDTEMIQLFQNLIANALKFRRAGVPPKVDIRCLEKPSEYIFSVSDNGIGIKEKDFERVFDIFTRLNPQHVFEGTGIGLATCKKILAAMNGQIWLSSTEGVGTTFYFSLPKDKSIVNHDISSPQLVNESS